MNLLSFNIREERVLLGDDQGVSWMKNSFFDYKQFIINAAILKTRI